MISTDHFHPMLVHFPIALVALGFVAELASRFIKKELCLSKVSFYLLIIGTLSAIASWLTGVLFTSEMSGAAGEVKETHELFALITVVLLIATSSTRLVAEFGKKDFPKLKTVAFVLYFLAAISVSITGFFGGNLVYSHMMPL